MEEPQDFYLETWEDGLTDWDCVVPDEWGKDILKVWDEPMPEWPDGICF